MAGEFNFCQYRALLQNYNVPPQRINVQNPYLSGNYTKFDLDMRRKVEILKYNSNKVSTQTNSFTQKEKFALLSRGRRGYKIPDGYQGVCGDPNQLLLTPTSSSGVPGKVIYLYENTNVPLYNYSEFNTRNYPDFVPDVSVPWQFISKPNVIVNDNESDYIYYLIVNSKINKQFYTYNIVTPIGLSVAGNIPAGYDRPDFSGNFNISIQTARLDIYYGTNFVKSVIDASLSSYGATINVPTVNESGGPLPFYLTHYIGNLKFNNIKLYTQPTYAYKFKLYLNLSVTPSNLGFSNYSISLITNISSDMKNMAVGCTLVNVASPSINEINSGASISGV